jgi:hypothetical protein
MWRGCAFSVAHRNRNRSTGPQHVTQGRAGDRLEQCRHPLEPLIRGGRGVCRLYHYCPVLGQLDVEAAFAVRQ